MPFTVDDSLGGVWEEWPDGYFRQPGTHAPAYSLDDLDILLGPVEPRARTVDEAIADIMSASREMDKAVDASTPVSYDSPKVHILSIGGTPCEAFTTQEAALQRGNRLAEELQQGVSLTTLEIY
ncbi:hypothetical protein SEA_SPEEDDEMON_720 [Gordonia phage SpeedDemon]|uniref:Uncharacterized protein n=1 Tax=Gordonia phage Bantam TaxID=1887641 RepID=A0A1B3AYC7_9CAUD|nr:hypothetical protein BIZ77_gp109 [Gordonia phage Bantam]AOE43759.1 hypothetical protein SEA_BANTAM_70 [Gordonia phage Bantam]QNL30522.1 hypothetical protein SEA_SPEEDDEMON_720 [Gordonia phage SpeedDemon]